MKFFLPDFKKLCIIIKLTYVQFISTPSLWSHSSASCSSKDNFHMLLLMRAIYIQCFGERSSRIMIKRMPTPQKRGKHPRQKFLKKDQPIILNVV